LGNDDGAELAQFLTTARTMLDSTKVWFGYNAVAVTEMSTYGMTIARPTILPMNFRCDPN
jgi:hypothetical protein